MVEPPEKPLQDTTDEVLSKEASADNVTEVKDEPHENVSQPQVELPDVTPPTLDSELLDATRNLLVALPPDMQLNLEDVPQIPTNTEVQVKPCSVKLHRCDIVSAKPVPRVPIEVNVVVQERAYDLRKREQDTQNPATSTSRAKRSVSLNVSYVSLFDNSSSEETSTEMQLNPPAPSKREPSHYRLAAHKYMLARKSGLITGPTVCTRASTIVKTDKNINNSSDSDATIILDETPSPQTPKKKPITGHNPKIGKKINQKHLSPKPTHSEEEEPSPKRGLYSGNHTYLSALCVTSNGPPAKRGMTISKGNTANYNAKSAESSFALPVRTVFISTFTKMDNLNVRLVKPVSPSEANSQRVQGIQMQRTVLWS